MGHLLTQGRASAGRAGKAKQLEVLMETFEVAGIWVANQVSCSSAAHAAAVLPATLPGCTLICVPVTSISKLYHNFRVLLLPCSSWRLCGTASAASTSSSWLFAARHAAGSAGQACSSFQSIAGTSRGVAKPCERSSAAVSCLTAAAAAAGPAAAATSSPAAVHAGAPGMLGDGAGPAGRHRQVSRAVGRICL